MPEENIETKLELFSDPKEKKIFHFRQFRNQTLAATDWSQLSDNGLTDEKREEWKVYRQGLRDYMKKITVDNIEDEELNWDWGKEPSFQEEQAKLEGGSNEGEQFGQSNFKG